MQETLQSIRGQRSRHRQHIQNLLQAIESIQTSEQMDQASYLGRYQKLQGRPTDCFLEIAGLENEGRTHERHSNGQAQKNGRNSLQILYHGHCKIFLENR